MKPEIVDFLNGKRHCDEYIGDPDEPNCLRWWLLLNRLSATDQLLARDMVMWPKLFATHKGKRVRVVMASRFGDVGITEVLTAEHGYSNRVTIDELSDFGINP
jgi:hypothetical protein